MTRKLSRREFVGEASRAAVGAGLIVGAGHAMAAGTADQTAKSTVVQVTHARAVSTARKVDPDAVRKMVQRGMKKLTGAKEPFKKLFSPEDRVGLKINCLGKRRIHTHHELVDAVAAELQAAGVPAKNIVVWDRFEGHMRRCGYDINAEGSGVRCYGTEERGGDLNRSDDRAVFVSSHDDADGRSKSGEASRLSRIFTTECDKIINLAILKDHGLAGVTLTLKNIAFGVCDNNRRFHQRQHIGPFIADFCAREDIREKFVLHMIDGIEGCFDGGPAPSSEDQIFQPKTLWMGTDPVALDTLGTAAIEAQRKEKGLDTLKGAGREPRHIHLAAKAGLGTDDLERIDLRRIKLS